MLDAAAMIRALAALAFLAVAACNIPSQIGSPCSVTADCEGGQQCNTSFNGGFCTKGCTFEGKADECPKGSICSYAGGTSMICAPTCSGDSQCRSLYYGCYPVQNSTLKACGPAK